MVLPFFFPAILILLVAGSGRGEEPSGGEVLRLIQIRLVTPSVIKITPAGQENSPQPRTVDSSSTNPFRLLFR
jgi:hypothetical protein